MSEPASRRPRRRRTALIVSVAALVMAADQITKSLAVADLSSHGVHVIGPFSLRLAYNTGVAFSVGTGLTGPIVVLAVAVVLAIAWMARGVPTTTAAVAFGLVLGGALGNLSDRIFRGHHGAVVDFVYTSFWPTFNLADSCIVVGCFLLALTFIRHGWAARTVPETSGSAAHPAGSGEGEADGHSPAPGPGGPA